MSDGVGEQSGRVYQLVSVTLGPSLYGGLLASVPDECSPDTSQPYPF